MFKQFFFRKIIICVLLLIGKLYTNVFAFELNFDYGLSSFFVLNQDTPCLYNSIEPGISISTNMNKQKSRGFFLSCAYVIPMNCRDLKQEKALTMHTPGGVSVFSGVQLEKKETQHLTSSVGFGLGFRWIHCDSEIEDNNYTTFYTETVSYGVNASSAVKLITDNIFLKAGLRAEYYPITLGSDKKNYFRTFSLTPILSVGNYF